MPSNELTRTLYRTVIRSSNRVRKAMRPGHVVIVAEVVQRFAAHRLAAPALTRALEDHGPLPLPGLVRQAFREPIDAQESSLALDTAFSALRSISSIEAFVQQNNKLFDSLEEISDREAPGEQPARLVASTILANAGSRA